MALNFPSSPADNDTFEGYIYKSATGTWDYNEATPDSLTLSTIRLTSTTDVTTSSTTHAFQIGPDNSNNLRIDINEISAINNGTVSTLFINPDGGNVTFFSPTTTVTVAGNTRLGLSETQAVVDVQVPVGGYTYANNTYTIDIASGNYFTNITTQRVYPTAWTEVGTGVSANSTASAPTFSLSSLNAQPGDIVIVFAATEAASIPTANATASPGWSTATSGSTTYGSAVFWKQMGATPDSSITFLTTVATASTFVAKAFRPTGIAYGSYTPVITTTTFKTGSTTTPDADPISTAYANALSITLMSNENINVTAITPPTTYVNTTSSLYYTGTTVGSYTAMAYKNAMISTAGTSEDTSAWSYTTNGAGTPQWSATTLFLQAYVDPTIYLINSSLSATYPASTYVLHINNPSAVTTTWTGATYAWQGGTAPTLSSTAPNNIVILETIDGSTFRGALLDSYA